MFFDKTAMAIAGIKNAHIQWAFLIPADMLKDKFRPAPARKYSGSRDCVNSLHAAEQAQLLWQMCRGIHSIMGRHHPTH